MMQGVKYTYTKQLTMLTALKFAPDVIKHFTTES